MSFRYNDEGVRTRKTVNGVETYFYLDGTNILAQKTGNDILWFNYDANGTRISITMPNGAVYYYAYNAQGDVIGLYSVNEYGYFVPQVYYTYDAWGKVLSITGNMADTLGQQNPFRYRGYYYDSETQFYYLNSRYYDPEVGRFINADGYVSTGQNILGSNMFTYCGNNPVNLVDSTGQFFFSALIVGGLILGGALLLTGCSATTAQKPEPYKSADEAARAFSEQVYSSSAYIRHEYSTEIYSRTIDGKTTYNFNPPRAGNPHSAFVGKSPPKGTKTVAYAHTHPNSNVFSGADIRVAGNLGIDAYVVGPNLELQRYNLLSSTTTNLGVISPVALTDDQRASLVEEFQVSWDTHIEAGCDFGCSNMTWPTP